MANWREKIINLLIYAGIGKEEYKDLRGDIREQNQKILMKAGIISAAFLSFIFLLSYRNRTLAPYHTLYAFTGLGLLLFASSIRTALKKHPQMILPGCYLYLLIMYVFAILLGTLTKPYIPATTFCVFLLAASFLFLDKPYRMSLFLLMVTVVFCVISDRRKPSEIAGLDMLNALCYLLLGIVCNIYLVHTKITNLLHHKSTKQEMDTDGLTRLMVKKAAEREIRRYISNTREPGTLLMIDLDNFKQVNDTKGHAYGDVVLKLTGDCIHKTFRSTDIKGRFGGDEFIVFLPGMSSRKSLTERLEYFKNLMEQGVTGEENRNGIHQSIGIAIYPEDGEDFQTLFERADEALYESKKRGKNRYCFYTNVKIGKGTSNVNQLK